MNLGTRICLGGEGLGLYGGKSITIPIDSMSTSVSIIPNKGEGIRVFCDHFKKISDDFFAEALAVLKIYRQHNLYPDNIDISIESSVPIGYGLASSATFYVCLTKTINNHFLYNLSDEELIRIAYTAEHVDQGVLVGLTDTYAVMNRKIMMQDHSVTPPQLTEIVSFPKNTMLLIAGGTPSFYKSLGEEIRERVNKNEQGIVRYKETVSKSIPLLAKALVEDNKANISEITATLFKSVCTDLCIKNQYYVDAINTAISSGAYAAKNTGLRSNGGGIVAFCSSENVGKVVRALAPRSFFTHVVSNDHIK